MMATARSGLIGALGVALLSCTATLDESGAAWDPEFAPLPSVAGDPSGGTEAGSVPASCGQGAVLASATSIASKDVSFGSAVAVSESMTLLGAPEQVSGDGVMTGAVVAFDGVIDPAYWYPSDGSHGSLFGSVVSVAGDVVAIGAPGDSDLGTQSGAVYIFERTDAGWVEVQKLVASDGSSLSFFGVSVAMGAGGDALVVGATGVELWMGRVYVYERDEAGVYEEVAVLRAEDGSPRELFGVSLATDGQRIAVGAMRHAEVGFDAGAVYLFRRLGGSWLAETKIVASDGRTGDSFGQAVALAGDVLVAGAPYRDLGDLVDVGAVYVTLRVDGRWDQQVRLDAADPTRSTRFGIQLAMSETGRLVVRSGGDPAGGRSGATLLDRCADGRWFAQPLAAEGAPVVDLTRQSVAVVGDRVIVGAGGDWHADHDHVQFFDLSRREASSARGIVASRD